MRLAAWALGLCWIVGSAQIVFAQAGAGAAQGGADAREAFRRGEAAYSAGNYDAAIREWLSAYQTDPRPRIQFNLSQAYERLGQLENAIRSLESFLSSGDPDDPTYSDANARLVALRERLGNTGVMVNGGSDGGSILVDDRDWGRTPRPDKITVTPGNHVLAIRWPDGREFRTSVFVPAGQVVDVSVPVAGAGAPDRPSAGSDSTQPTPDTRQPAKDRRLLWYSLGGGAAALGVGLMAYGGVRRSATSECGGDTYCDPDDEDAANRQAIAGFVSGGVLIAAGAALFVVGAVSHKKRDIQAKTQCGLGFASATCRFRF